MGTLSLSKKQAVKLMQLVTHDTFVRITKADADRVEVDAQIGNYFGYMRSFTQALKKIGFDTKEMHTEIAEYLRVLKLYNKNFGYASALKFALEELKYEDVQDI
jgi:hypothetical protein